MASLAQGRGQGTTSPHPGPVLANHKSLPLLTSAFTPPGPCAAAQWLSSCSLVPRNLSHIPRTSPSCGQLCWERLCWGLLLLWEGWSRAGPGDQGKMSPPPGRAVCADSDVTAGSTFFFFPFPFLCCLFCILLGEADSRLVAALRFRRDAAAAWAPPWLSPGAAHPRGCSLPSLALTRAGAGVSVLVLHQGTAAQGPSLWPFTGRSQHWETSKQKPLDKLRASPGGVGHPSSAAPSLFLGAQGGFGALPGPHPGSGPAAAACQAKGPRRGSCCHRADGESFCLAFPRGDAITRCCHPSTQGFATARPAAGARPCSLLLFHTTPAAPGMAELPRGRGEPRPVCAGAWPRGAARPWWGLTCAGLSLHLPPPPAL